MVIWNMDDDERFEDDDEFVAACAEKEDSDRELVWNRFKRMKNGQHRKALLPTVDISPSSVFWHLKSSAAWWILGEERRVDECYRRNAAKIVPLLKAEYISAERRLKACPRRSLAQFRWRGSKGNADAFCDDFCKALKDSIQGSIITPANSSTERPWSKKIWRLDPLLVSSSSSTLFSFTCCVLSQEICVLTQTVPPISITDIQGCPMSVSERKWDHLLQAEVRKTQHSLYGGSQYHVHCVSLISRLDARCLRLPTITEDEIANAAGIGETHDGVNFLRAACVIALEESQMPFDPLLYAFRLRIGHWTHYG